MWAQPQRVKMMRYPHSSVFKDQITDSTSDLLEPNLFPPPPSAVCSGSIHQQKLSLSVAVFESDTLYASFTSGAPEWSWHAASGCLCVSYSSLLCLTHRLAYLRGRDVDLYEFLVIRQGDISVTGVLTRPPHCHCVKEKCWEMTAGREREQEEYNHPLPPRGLHPGESLFSCSPQTSEVRLKWQNKTPWRTLIC